jgi:hypothetical protein
MDKKIDKIVNEVLGADFKLSRIVEFEDYLYVFYEHIDHDNPYNDERFGIMSGAGPLKINKITLEHEITSLVEFYFEHGDNELFFPKKEKITFESSIKNILMRGRINWEDFYIVLENFNLESDEYDIWSVNSTDDVYIKVKSEKAYNILIEFLEKLKANYVIDLSEKNKLFVNLNLIDLI